MISALRAEGLGRKFGDVVGLDDVTIDVAEGSVTGLLGHNGAGKTTFVRLLATLLRPTSGRAWVHGYDVVAEADAVRRCIGLTGQYAALDDDLTGFDNLVLIARLLGFGRRRAKERADEALEVFDLADAGQRVVRTYSGGMRRRLDIACSLVGRPAVLFLDEPTTGLDPRSRSDMWNLVRRLVVDGTTVLLTTQYLDEADRLADRVVLLDRGRVVADGTPEQLKQSVRGDHLVLRFSDARAMPGAATAISHVVEVIGQDPIALEITAVIPSTASVAAVLRGLDELGIEVGGLRVDQPTLDDVYATYTTSGSPLRSVS